MSFRAVAKQQVEESPLFLSIEIRGSFDFAQDDG